MGSQIKIDSSWKMRLEDEFKKPYMAELKIFLKSQYDAGKTIFPKGSEYFSAFNHTPFEKVRVVILGQDPYHGPNQANGLCFSVNPGVRFPPSLLNIFKELHSDLHVPMPKNGDLSKWADQGVLLLNSVLTVEQSQAASHEGKGWETFTNAVIKKLNEERQQIAYVLWGSYAQKKAAFVNREKNFIIESPHPSPLSAHRGFLGSKPFSKINQYLISLGEEPINWAL